MIVFGELSVSFDLKRSFFVRARMSEVTILEESEVNLVN